MINSMEIMKKLGADKSNFYINSTNSSIGLSYTNQTLQIIGDKKEDVVTNNNVFLLLRQNKTSGKRVEKLEAAYQNIANIVDSSDSKSEIFNGNTEVSKLNKTEVSFKELSGIIKSIGGAEPFFENNNVFKTIFKSFKRRCANKSNQDVMIKVERAKGFTKGDEFTHCATVSYFDTISYQKTIDRYLFNDGNVKKSISDLAYDFFKINFTTIKGLVANNSGVAKIMEDNDMSFEYKIKGILDILVTISDDDNIDIIKTLFNENIPCDYFEFGVYKCNKKLSAY